MSRLTDLIRQAKAKDAQFGADLEAEVRELTRRRSFGLLFERHQPEAVELPNVKVSVGESVRVLPPRGETGKGDRRLWRVIARGKDKTTVELVELRPADDAEAESRTAPVYDLVVVAEFHDRMYPGLVETGRVERGGDTPFHTVINGENYHALQMLTYTHRGKVDAIYIDPPYNTGAKDWKYNNDYVEGDDAYRHSKWLAMMERRLLLAKELLNPDDSVLIVTIDEKEYLRLGLLLEQVFADARIQMVSAIINPKGTGRSNEFSRIEEFIFFVASGGIRMSRHADDMVSLRDYRDETEVRWRGLARTGAKGRRGNNPGSWYPIYVHAASERVVGIGETLLQGGVYDESKTPKDTIAVWPPSVNGADYSWSVVPETLRSIQARGGLRLGRIDVQKGRFPLYYISAGIFRAIDEGTVDVVASEVDGTLRLQHAAGVREVDPRTVWNRVAHDAGSHGTGLVRRLMPDRSFPFPKSLYAVEDSLRFFVKDKPGAIVLDFFSGSGTTAHAVMRLNKQDGGRRQCISITNNEVAADEQKRLRKDRLRPGDPDWEKWGICDYITKPRIEAAITGKTPDGDPIKGDYKFTDDFPMAEGFEQNATFFTLTYEKPMSVSRGRAFERIAPLLWLRAGATGPVLTDVYATGWAASDTYGVLAVDTAAPDFVNAVIANEQVRTAFIITDEDSVFRAVSRQLPADVEPVRLYESYMHTFDIAGGSG